MSIFSDLARRPAIKMNAMSFRVVLFCVSAWRSLRNGLKSNFVGSKADAERNS